MPLARIGNKVLFFVHIPKTGGSSIETYLGQKGTVALRFKRRMGWSASTTQHMHAAIHTKIIPDSFYDAGFVVLRDPVARFTSEYRYQKDMGRTSQSFADWAVATLGRYADDPYILDNHIRPQSEFLRPGLTKFLFEDGLSPIFDWIDRVTDTPPGNRDLWEKRAKPMAIDVPQDVRRKLESFYAADYRAIDRVTG